MTDEDEKKKRVMEFLKKDPKYIRRMVLGSIGASAAAKGLGLEFEDDLPLEDRQFALEGYMAAQAYENAKAPWYMRLPIIRRMFRGKRVIRNLSWHLLESDSQDPEGR